MKYQFLVDDSGDLINLAWIEAITMTPLEEGQEAPEGHTHEIIAVNSDQLSYRLFSGNEEACRQERARITRLLTE